MRILLRCHGIRVVGGVGMVAALLAGGVAPAAEEPPLRGTAVDESLEKAEPSLQVAQAPLAGRAEAATISLDFKEADIRTVLQALARKADVNIVAGTDVSGAVNVHLEEVTWEQALAVITKTYGYAYEKDGNVILVTTLEEMRQRRAQMRELQEMEPVTTRVIQLKFLEATDVRDFLEPQLSPQGRISVLEMTGQKGWKFGTVAAGSGGGGVGDTRERRERENARSKAIMITDTPTTLERLERILAQIDVMPQQILIESRVMEVNRDLLRDLGLELGTGTSSTSVSSSSGFSSSTGGRTFSQVDLNARPDPETADSSLGGSILNQFLTPSVFNPETTGLTAANTGLSVVFQKLRGTQAEILVRALEEDVRTNTLSAPHVLTLSGQEARLLIGEKFPILNTQVSGTSTSVTTTTLDYYQDIGIELFVVPQVSGERHIDMIIHPVVSIRTGSVGDNQYPILDVREAETQVIMEHGETIAIGGLLKDIHAKSRVGLPFLGKLPIVGPLFARSTTDVSKVDLLIFITAKIVKPNALSSEELLRLQQQYQTFLQEQRSRKPPLQRDLSAPRQQVPTTPLAEGEGNRGILYQKP